MKLEDCMAVILIIGIVILLMLVGSCTYRNAPKLECNTVTEVTRECHSEGSGKSLQILIEKKVDE